MLASFTMTVRVATNFLDRSEVIVVSIVHTATSLALLFNWANVDSQENPWKTLNSYQRLVEVLLH